MLRTLSLLAIGVCANALVGLSASAQAAPEVTLTRFDCGTGTAPIDPARFSDTFAFPELKVTLTRLIPLTQVNLYVVGAAPGADRRFCEDCLA